MISLLVIRGPILNIKQDRLLENYHFQDVACRDTLKKEQEAILAIYNAEDVDNTQPDERQASTVTLPLPSEHNAKSQYNGSVHKTIETSRTLSIISKCPTKVSDFLHSILSKISRCIPCLHLDLENYNTDLFDDSLRGLDLFGATPLDTMPVIEDIELVKQINDLWNFFCKLDTLKSGLSRANDEALYTQLQSKTPKHRHECSPVEMLAMSVMEDAKSGSNI
ncbi:hypothetical protein IW261DRAFT_1562643 [Armillaria novae-zelandiae]|uniref:Uncharacterized protein n=1 Tax=Armillaria novae-zelandiae TaxID=153914 RepID=A0AA39PBX0_9AGAR|nr:hypothetical protein IW261DRAFT_1562643 [Armillaria novae-zelandiae]